VEAFHGTSLDRAKESVRKGQLRASENVWDWLGHGVYFWEGSPTRALQWAEEKYGSQAAVVKATVHLGHSIDLCDPRWAPTLQVVYERMARAHRKLKTPLPENRGGNHALDCAVVNMLCEDYYQADTVRAPFIEGRPIFPGSMLYDLSHIQIVVRNAKMIEGPLEIVSQMGE
jgi:hypothetical protein